MGSVIDECDCPKCGHRHCYSELYYKVGVEFLSCPRCGYGVQWDDMYEIDKKPKKIVYGGFGSYAIWWDGIGEQGSFGSADDYKKFVEEYQQSGFVADNGERPTAVVFSVKENRKWKLRNLITNTEYEYTRDTVVGCDGEITDWETVDE